LNCPAPCRGPDRFTVMTTVRIAHTEPWPGKRVVGRGFGFFSMLVVLADDSGRALPVWLNGPEGHDLFRGPEDRPHPESAAMITAGLLRTAGVTVTGVDIDELDAALTAGPRRGRETPQATTRIEFTAAGTAEPRQLPVRIGYALAMAAATGAPIRVADQLMDQLPGPALGSPAGSLTWPPRCWSSSGPTWTRCASRSSSCCTHTRLRSPYRPDLPLGSSGCCRRCRLA
jgi:hypothetical protein